MKIYLVRHGQSEGNLRDLWYGSTDLPLTDLGREQAREAGEKLREVPFAACYVSPLSRARETAELVLAGRDVPVTIVPDLREQHMGLLETMTVDDICREMPDLYAEMQHDWLHADPPEGESFANSLAPRVAAALDAIVAKGEDCLIVAHNGPLTFAVAHLLQLPLEVAGRLYLRQGTYTMIELGGEYYNSAHALLRYFNK